MYNMWHHYDFYSQGKGRILYRVITEIKIYYVSSISLL